jgi:hypothetical protein
MLKESRDHLDQVDETYGEHFTAALGIAAMLAKASAACAVHALIPALCTGTASRCVARLHANFARRGVVLADLAPDTRSTRQALS